MPGIFSFFKNGITTKVPTKNVSLDSAVKMIREGAFRDDVERLRGAGDPHVQKVIKSGLPWFSFSGTFKYCNTEGLLQHSGLICLDFDDLIDIAIAKAYVCQISFVTACFISPSGNGLKVLVQIDSRSHLESFLHLEAFFAENALVVDKSGKDVTRACYVSFDPEIYFNPDALILKVEPSRASEVLQQTPAVVPSAEIKTDLQHVEYVVAQLEEQGIDLTENYQDWLEVGFALAALGEEAREIYHRICVFHQKYHRKEADVKFTDALNKGRFTSPAKFFALAKAAGVDIRRPKNVTTVADVATIAEKTAETEKSNAPYTLTNHDLTEHYWQLVTNDGLLQQMLAEGQVNLVSDLLATTKDVCDELRAIGKTVFIQSRDPQEDIELCLSLVAQGFRLSVCTIKRHHVDFATWLVEHYTAHKSKDKIAESLTELSEHVSWFPNGIEREQIAQNIAKASRISKPTIVKEINGFKTSREDTKVQNLDDGDEALPAWVSEEQREDYYRLGWFSHEESFKTGIYFSTGNGPKRLTNFVLTPLIHIYTKEDMGNRRLTELNNGFAKPVIELPGKAFTSMEVFDAVITGEGNFYTFDGFTKSHLNKLKSFYLGEYPKCFELNTLGWQPEGFFSFSNLIYKEKPVEYNKYGYAEIEGTNYLSMGASNVLEGVRSEDDIYANDKFLAYKKAELSFEDWTGLMVKVYPEHGMLGVAFAMMAVFRDLLFRRNRNFPMLYPYGTISSGKSKFAESITALFTGMMPLFNLNQGTDFAFFARLGRFRNVAVGLNEFDENAIKDEWFRAIKGVFDGEGREKGSGRGKKTTSQEIHAAIILIGQFLSTRDDNSVLSRTMPCKFMSGVQRTEQQKGWYQLLKDQEEKGLSSLLCDVLDHRRYFADHFINRYNKISNDLTAAFTKDGITPKDRILENYSVALAVVSLMGEKMSLGFSYDAFFAYCKGEVGKLNSVMSESNSLSQFWKTVEFLLDQDVIEHGNHFKIETHNEVRISVDRNTTQMKKFDESKKLLFVRMGTLHQLYSKEVRSQTGKQGLNEQTVLSYMKDQPYYIGSNPGSRFASAGNTSSFVLDYDLLAANLERFKEDDTKTVTLSGTVHKDAEVTDVIGEAKLSFTFLQDESYPDGEGNQVNKMVYTSCISDDTTRVHLLKRGREIKITGILSETKGKDSRVWRRMKVTDIEIVEAELPFERSEAEVDAVFPETNKN